MHGTARHFTKALPRFFNDPHHPPVLDIRRLVVHCDGTLILDRLDQRVERRPDLLPPEGR